MRKVQRLTFLTALVALSAVAAAAADDVSFSVDYPRQVVEGNKFQITFTLRNAKGSNLMVPDFGDGVTKVYGPSTSTSYSSQWVNGVSTSSSSEQYTLMYRADKAGKYTMAEASVTVDGKQYSTSPFTIEILPPDQSATAGNQQQSVQIDKVDTQKAGKEVSSDDIFIRISMSKSNVYEQEAVVCTIKLYTKYNISQFMTNVQPSFNGFLIEELPVKSQLNEIERVNGENYMTAELKRCILFPQQSGKLTITSGTYDVTVVQYESYRSFFGTMRQPVEKQLTVKSNSATVEIKPLPEPRPASFNGAVGDFSVSDEVRPQVLKSFEAASLEYVIKGTGNIKYVKAPEIAFPAQFEVYDPQYDCDAKPSGSNVTGTMKVDYTFIPQYVGKYEIPATEFTYFNPSKREYVTLQTPAHELTVAQGGGGAAAAAVAAARQGIEQQNKDILHIKTGDLNLKRNHEYMVGSGSYWLWYIVPLLLLAAILIYSRKALKERADLQRVKGKRANKVAKKRLRTAQQHMKAGDAGKFYAETLTALWGYLSDKLHIPVSELNKENISAELEAYGAAEADIAATLEALNKCEFAQYAPELSGNDMNSVFNEVSEVMNKLENTKRKKA